LKKLLLILLTVALLAVPAVAQADYGDWPTDDDWDGWAYKSVPASSFTGDGSCSPALNEQETLRTMLRFTPGYGASDTQNVRSKAHYYGGGYKWRATSTTMDVDNDKYYFVHKIHVTPGYAAESVYVDWWWWYYGGDASSWLGLIRVKRVCILIPQ